MDENGSDEDYIVYIYHVQNTNIYIYIYIYIYICTQSKLRMYINAHKVINVSVNEHIKRKKALMN